MRLLIGLLLLFVAQADENATPESADNPAESSSVVIVEDRSTGCFHNLGGRVVYEWDGEAYTNGERRFTKAQVESARETLLTAREGVEGVLDRVGVTPETVKQHHDEILATVRAWNDDWPEKTPPELEALIVYDHVRPIALQQLVVAYDSTTRVVFELTLPGDPPITAKSEHEVGWMLPWTVTAGDETWQTYSLDVPRALRTFASKDGPNASLLDGDTYWRDAFWHDGMFWHMTIGEEFDSIYSRSIAESLPGWDRAADRFEFRDSLIGNVNLAPRSLFMELRDRKASPANRVRWHNVIIEKEPSHD